MVKYPIRERNEMLCGFFEELGFEVKLLGDRNQPKIIVTENDKSFVVSGYVKNKLYHFTSEPFGGTEVLTINLNDTSRISKMKVKEILSTYTQRNFYTIKIKGVDVHYLKTENNSILFSCDDKRYFFDEDKAISTIEYLKDRLDVELSLIKNSKCVA